MKILELSKIGFFNPGRLSDEEIELSFIARQTEFEQIFQSISAEDKNSIPQHHLIIGQRGMGKTSLLMRIAAELRKPEYAQTFLALTFPEEQYNVDRLSKFWLNCLDALADALDREEKKETTAELDKKIAALDRTQQKDSQAIYAEFEKWCDQLQRRPVLLVDNLNLIFSKISISDQHQLRAILMKKNAPIMVGASAVVPEETVQYGSPFYDGFSMHYLRKLSFEENMKILVNLGKITGIPDYEEIAWKNKGRLGALYHLTGGTPRTISMLFPLIRDGFSEGIQSDLDALLDVVTPIYKAKFEELSDQQQVILDAIALNWDPITLEKLREVSQLGNNVLSAQLKRLMEIGWIEKLEQEKKKFPAYELTERFFNIWYLMRRSSRRQKQELYCLSRFLEVFYGPEILTFAANWLDVQSKNPNQIAVKLALSAAIKDDAKLSAALEDQGWKELIELGKSDPTMLNDFEIPENRKIEMINFLYEEFMEGEELLDPEEQIKKLKLLANLDKNNIELNLLISFAFYRLEKYEESATYIHDYINKQNDYILWGAILADIYQFKLFNYEKSEFIYRNSIKNNYNDIQSKIGLIFLLRDVKNDYEESLLIFKSISDEFIIIDYLLHKIIFSYHDCNINTASESLNEILSKLEENPGLEINEHWYRTGAVVVRLGYGQHFLDQLASNGYDVILRPYYTAIQALMHENADLFLNSVASEVREPARKILAFMKRYNQGHTIQKPKNS